MKSIGIIAEYNPFHNGHAYQIRKIREQTHADFVIVAMSGNFVQRGCPAIVDKFTRTKMALSCGADLVIELPSLWATASAELFAMGGVTLFDKMGCIDGLCFGAETNDLETLSQIADILVNEPTEYQEILSNNLKQGLSFPSARANAIEAFFSTKDISDIINTPNNILAIEYLKALKKRNSNIKPLLLKREGAGYHDTIIRDASLSDAPSASASAIRKILQSNTPISNQCFSVDSFKDSMPNIVLNILKEQTYLYEDDFSSILNYLLLCHSSSESNRLPYMLADIADCNEFIANRIAKNRHDFQSFSQFIDLNKSKDVTYTRMSRIFTHAILQISNADYSRGKNMDYIPYLRILGFKKDSSAVLSEIKKCSDVPMISKLADASTFLSVDGQWLLEKDLFASELYEQCLANKKRMQGQKNLSARNEFSRELVIIA